LWEWGLRIRDVCRAAVPVPEAWRRKRKGEVQAGPALNPP